MSIWGRIGIFILLEVVGLTLIRYTLAVVNFAGKSQWAERHLGAGGTFTMWKIVGSILLIVGFAVLFGWFALGLPPTPQG